MTQAQPAYCDHCGTKIGEYRNGQLFVFGKHHGERHETAVRPSALDKRRTVPSKS